MSVAETDPEVQKELLAVSKVKVKPGDTAESFTRRVFDKINSIVGGEERRSSTDPDQQTSQTWESLSDPAQAWMNAANIAAEAKQPLTPLELSLKEEAAEPAEEAQTEEESSVVNGSESAEKSVKKKAPAKKAVAKSAAKKAVKAGDGRGRKGSFPLDATIKLLAEENPHRKGSKDYDKFKKLKNGMTVESAVKALAGWGYLRYLAKRREDIVKIG